MKDEEKKRQKICGFMVRGNPTFLFSIHFLDTRNGLSAQLHMERQNLCTWVHVCIKRGGGRQRVEENHGWMNEQRFAL